MPATAVILAGGFGTRLKSIVSDLPKPMAPVNGRPFLDYQLDFLANAGFKKVIFSTGYFSEKISAHYQATYNDIHISYVHEKLPLGTGGGIRLALEACEDKEALVLNGDSFFDLDLKEFIKLHRTSGAKISLALRKVTNAGRYGTITTNEAGQITAFHEKSTLDDEGTINAGVYMIDKQFYLDNTRAHEPFSIEKDLFEKKLGEIKMMGYSFDGYFIDIGIPEDYLKAQDDFKGFKHR